MGTFRPSRTGRMLGLLLVVLGLVLAPLGAAFAAPGDPGTIAGEVLGPDGLALSGATVTLYDDVQQPVGSTQLTGADGLFEFGGLDGTYYVGATKAGVGTVFYDGATSLADAFPLFPDPSFGEQAVLQMPTPPAITGTVSSSAGPIDGATITAYASDGAGGWDQVDYAFSDAAGHYEFSSLSPQQYRLGFEASGQLPEYWNDKPDVTSADNVNVVAGQTRTANAQLADPLLITGTVTGAGSTPLQGADVVAEQEVTQFGDTFWDQVAFATTAANGTYSLEVAPGTYRVRFDATTYLGEYWNDALDEVDADLVTVTSATVPNINAALSVGGKITGTIRDTASVPITSASATAYRLVNGSWSYVASASTNGSGVYTIDGLRGGTYRVEFSSFGGGWLDEFYQDKDTIETATDVPVTLGGTATANATLDKGGIIGGTVTGPSGNLAGATVTLYRPSRFSDSGWSYADSDTTPAAGTYSFTGLVPGAYRVCVTEATGLALECWNDKPEVFLADTITAAKNSSATANIALAAARHITGTLTSKAGGALTTPEVSAYRKQSGPEGTFWQFVTSATPGAGGAYSVDVAPGTYKLLGTADEHVSAWSGGTTLLSRATRVVVTGADQSGQNIALDRLGRVAGTVTGPSGPITGATVRVYRWSGSDFVQVRSTLTSAGGTYAVTGLIPGNYRVGFTAAGMTPEYNLDKADVDLGDDVAVSYNAVATVNAALVSNQRTLSGTVTAAAGGAALTGVTVRVERRVVVQDDVRWRLADSTTTTAGGAWSVTEPDGTYRVGFQRSGYLAQWYSGATTAETATLVAVTGANRTGLNAAMAVGGTISGTVTGPSGAITDGSVTFYREVAPGNLDYEDEVALGAAGAYASPALRPGTYVVQFGADGYVPEYYNDSATAAGAQRFVVTTGSTATANAVLARSLVLSGTVTGPGATALPDVDVTIEKFWDFGGGDTYWDYETSATTNASGAWTADVGAGTFRVSFERNGYVTEWWNDATTAAGAQSLVITNADRPGIDALLSPAAVLRGTISGPDGPVDGWVTVYPASATDLATAPELAYDFASDGQYLIDSLAPGSYKVRFESSRLLPEFYNDKADLATANPVAVSTAAPTTVNATLARGRAIAGTLTGVGGAIEDGSVDFYQRQTDGSYDYVDSDDTDADGGYRAYLPAGTYTLQFSGYDNRLSEWWNNAATQAAATTVVLGSAADVTGIDAVLDDGATVSGKVTFPQRLSGWDSSVQLYDTATGSFAGSATVNAYTNAYTISDLPPGTYRAQFARTPGYDVAEAQFYSGKSENLGVAASTTLTLGVAQVQTGVNAVLVEGGRFTGRVRDTASNPIAGCVVTAYTSDGTLVGRASRPSAADGTYVVPGLTTGSYLLRVTGGGCGSSTSYYDGAGTLSPSGASAVPVAATRGTSTAVPQDMVVGPPDAPPMVNNSLPTINDTTPEVGQVLTATTGTWTPSDGTYTYQWLASGVAIAGATTNSYTVVAGDVGKTLAVRVTASKAGFTSVSATSAATTAVPAPPTMANNVLPAISDTTPAVAQTLTATSGTWTPSDGTYAYQWLADGSPIAGATAATYTVAAGNLGKVLAVRVTASKAGFVSASATSAATSAVGPQPQVTNTAPPTVSDTTPEVGQVLTAVDGTWTPRRRDLHLPVALGRDPDTRRDVQELPGARRPARQEAVGAGDRDEAEYLPATATSTETTPVVAGDDALGREHGVAHHR